VTQKLPVSDVGAGGVKCKERKALLEWTGEKEKGVAGKGNGTSVV
jgi:hypothetical protein